MPAPTSSCPSPLTRQISCSAFAPGFRAVRNASRWPAHSTTSAPCSMLKLEPGKPATIGQVILKARGAQPFYARHPWVYAGAIERIEGEPADGDEVDLLSDAGKFIARGLFNS